ncbi:MAG: MotA/TolQ/ExbB proton channel family protein [Myxococcaceae bacterium]
MHIVTHLKQALTGLHASWVMWLLLLLSAASLVLIIERVLFFRSIRDDVPGLARELDELLRATRYRDALHRMRNSKSAEASVVVAGLLHADMGPVAAQQAMEGAVALERMRLERGLAFLGTLGNNAPFIGLLGTVIGVIEAFEVLGATDALRATAGSSSAIMGGISEALVATAVGLFVAIPAVVAFNYFQRRIQSVLANTEALSKVLLAHLNAEEAPNPPRVEDSTDALQGGR